jgi:pimeloyl-ACP methyl ester carboxylesterase
MSSDEQGNRPPGEIMPGDCASARIRLYSSPMTRPPVLLIHSGGFTSRQWRKLGEALAPDYDVIAPDLLGYGASGAWPVGEPFHFRQDLEFLQSLLGEPAHLVGHSYGGFLALQLALARPELVRSIAVYDPVAFGVLDRPIGELLKRWEPDASGIDEGWLQEFVDWWNGGGAWGRLPEETRNAFRSVGWKLHQEVVTLAADRTSRAAYATITAPTLLLGGATSPALERQVVEALAGALPNARMKIVDGAGHMGPITHAGAVNGAIIEHLRQ